MQVSRTTLKIRFGATQRPRSAFCLHELHRLRFAHPLATVRAMSASERGREFEPHDFSFHYSGHMHYGQITAKRAVKQSAKAKQPSPCELGCLLIVVSAVV